MILIKHISYKSITIAGLLTLLFFFLLIHYNYIILSGYLIPTIVTQILSWAVLACIIEKTSIQTILLLFCLLALAIWGDNHMGFRMNPVTISSIILFWLGVLYLIIPDFFKKYKWTILCSYGLILLYFLIVRFSPNYFEAYHSNFLYLQLSPIPIFALLWIYEQWKWTKTLKAEKARAELNLLKSQINPHFFFNTLNNLYGLVIEKSDEAPSVILKLSDMMRYTIHEGQEDQVLLKEEIDYLKNYIELHKIRFQKKVDIQFQYDVEDGLKVAPLLFINLVENAFKHGAEKMVGKAYVHINMKAREYKLNFTVENNYDPTLPVKNSGTGVKNLKERLAHFYPNKHELLIHKNNSVYKAELNLSLV